jgi:hypothetical protein
MSINLFSVSMKWRYLEILAIKMWGKSERALFYIDETSLEVLFFKIY